MPGDTSPVRSESNFCLCCSCPSFVLAILAKATLTKKSSIMTTLRGFGLVMYVSILMRLVLVEYICSAAAVAEQVPRLATANTSTTCCCEHVTSTAAVHITHEITPIYSIHESPRSRSIQVELGKVEGFWSVLQLLAQAWANYLNVEQRAHWLLIYKETITYAIWWCHYVRLS